MADKKQTVAGSDVKAPNSNLAIYEKVRVVPDTAKKPIKGGRLSGMTDINPMWRIKTLTETFGVCGFGWRYEITKQWLENGASNEIAAFVNLNLYVKMEGAWSEPIQGTGGSKFIAKESSGLYNNDECFKMAMTDALSVACKSLGIAADVYFEKDRTKYDLDGDVSNNQQPKGAKNTTNQPTQPAKSTIEYITDEQKARFTQLGITDKSACVYCNVTSIDLITKAKADAMIKAKESRTK